MVKNMPFKGMPVRKENILKELVSNLDNISNDVFGKLVQLFKLWLDNHALLDPELWAKQRSQIATENDEYYSDNTAESYITSTVDEYFRMKSYNDGKTGNWQGSGYSPSINWMGVLQKMIYENDPQPEQFPIITDIANLFHQDEIEQMKEELSYSGLEEMNERLGTSFTDVSQMEDYIDNLTAEQLEFDFSDLLNRFDDIEGLGNSLEEYGLLQGFVYMLNTFVFPQWRLHWGSQGIEETRSGVEATYEDMIKAKSLDDRIIAIHRGLTATHQSGDMLDHFDSYKDQLNLAYEDYYEDGENDQLSITEVFTALSEGEGKESWDAQLREIGVEI